MLIQEDAIKPINIVHEETLNRVLYLGAHKSEEFFSSSELLFCLGPDHEGEGARRGGVDAARDRGVHELEEEEEGGGVGEEPW